MKWLSIAPIAALLTVVACGPTNTSTTTGADSAVNTAPEWTTWTSTDEMSGVKTQSASIDSTDKFADQLGNRDKPTEITVRYRGKRPEVMLENSNLQILCGEYQAPLRVKFDDRKPQSFSCSESATHDYGIGFINAAPRFVAEIKKAKTMIVEANVYQRGAITMHFALPPMPSMTDSKAKPRDATLEGHKAENLDGTVVDVPQK